MIWGAVSVVTQAKNSIQETLLLTDKVIFFVLFSGENPNLIGISSLIESISTNRWDGSFLVDKPNKINSVASKACPHKGGTLNNIITVPCKSLYNRHDLTHKYS